MLGIATLALSAAASHDLLEWIAEVGREVAIDHHHIAEYGPPALVVVVVIGTVLYLVKSY
jgi:hypothetical protein